MSSSSSSSSMLSAQEPAADHRPPVINYILSFLLVGLAWGLTTPFIRRAARTHAPPARAFSRAGLHGKLRAAAYAVVDLLSNPRYAVPLLLNLTGSVWFFLLIGKAELSLTVPIVNATAFLFTVLGEWLAEGKMISLDTGVGVILSMTGIALCALSKS
ncbi:Transmembrane protein 234 -like protein [Escovopsis weberi]|uniref:Transmembrane protein 234-like protein n=1 Tax=Escovopsis weberi TaxID=150374 RepID=A0A0M9VX21_ESCWE|nr:Transmembrane protein 234 -like protein [Escovopsis weberi]